MLCSARPAGKSGSNWLDRLRFNKGIPTGDGLDLDSFLTTATATDSPHSKSDPTGAPTRTRSRETLAAGSDPPMTSVLAELFNMGSSLCHGSKKCPRKQTHPKSFVPSPSPNNDNSGIVIDPARRNDYNAPAAVANSFNGDAAEVRGNVVRDDDEEEEDEQVEDGNNELMKGFTRSEVTVIDTSCQGWKVEKLVFRKNNVWKVRERRGKSRFFNKKKKTKPTLTAALVENNGNNGGGGEHNHNHNHKPLVFQFGNSSESNWEQEVITPSAQGQRTQHERRDACKDTQDDLRPPPKKRQVHLQAACGFLFPGLPENQERKTHLSF